MDRYNFNTNRRNSNCSGPGRPAAGMTLLEVVVALAIVSILAGAMVPIIVAQVDRENYLKTVKELDTLSDGLDAYFEDHGAFPVSLESSDFLGRYVQTGVDRDTITDAWGGARLYGYVLSRNKDMATIISVGPNGIAEQGKADDIMCKVYGAVAGNRRTRTQLDLIALALEQFLAGGKSLTGNWLGVDRENLGLGTEFDRDGFGTPFKSAGDCISIRSAGPDRRFNTGDDLTL